MEAHIKTARAHSAISYFYGFVGLLACVFPYLVMTSQGNGPGDVLLASVFPALFFGMSFLHLAVARGAKQQKNWARLATIVIGVLSLFGFPVGTIIGIYLLVNSSWPNTNVSMQKTS